MQVTSAVQPATAGADYDDEDDEDSQEYDLYYALKNSNKHVVWADLEDIPQYVQDAFVYTED